MPTIEIACKSATELPLQDLTEFQGELKSLSKVDYKRLRKQIIELGFSASIHVWQNDGKNYILDGHQRVRTLRNMAENENYDVPPLPVTLVDADSYKQAKLKLLGMTSQYGRVEGQGLYEYLVEGDIDIQEVIDGYRLPEIDIPKFEAEFLQEKLPLSGDPNDAPPRPVEPMCKPGELWEVGRHRIFCGDSANHDHASRLLNDLDIEAVWTDPPYGVSYVGKTEDKLNMKNDNQKGLEDMLTEALRIAREASTQGAGIYVSHPAGPLSAIFLQGLTRAGWKVAQALVWVKHHFVMGRSDYHYQHEPIWYGWNPGGTHKWIGGRDKSSVFNIERPTRSTDHPTMKPVELVRQCIRNTVRKGAFVYDPFLGSGTTIMACESLGLTGIGMELDPGYCHVAIRRWEDFTGQKAQPIYDK